jgi:hemolysin III
VPHVPVFQHAIGKWRPSWRGRIHGVAVAVTIPAGVVLTLLTPSGLPRIAVLVYVLSLLALFSTSASYHLLTRSQRAQRTMRQLDHAMAYVLIAGTYTPVCLLALPSNIGVPFLIVIWLAAGLGITLKITWRAHKTSGAMYLVIGWAALIILPWSYHMAGFTSLLLFALGGIVYTVGAILFYLQRPQLKPLVFGFHEVWHVFTVVAVALQFAGVGVLIARVG